MQLYSSSHKSAIWVYSHQGPPASSGSMRNSCRVTNLDIYPPLDPHLTTNSGQNCNTARRSNDSLFPNLSLCPSSLGEKQRRFGASFGLKKRWVCMCVARAFIRLDYKFSCSTVADVSSATTGMCQIWNSPHLI